MYLDPTARILAAGTQRDLLDSARLDGRTHPAPSARLSRAWRRVTTRRAD